MNRGFTVVEVLITLIIMAILLTLGTIGIRSSLVNARDAERQSDIEIIARGLEEYYKRGHPYYIAGPTKGSYPGSNTMIAMSGAGWCDTAYFKNPSQAALYSVCRRYHSEALPGVSDAALTAPDRSGPELANPWLVDQAEIPNWINTAINEGKYVYLPLTETGAHCYSDTSCPRYELYYKKEATGEKITVKSKHK